MATEGEMEMARRKAAGLVPDRAVAGGITSGVASQGAVAQNLPGIQQGPGAAPTSGITGQVREQIRVQQPVPTPVDQTVRQTTPRPVATPAPAAPRPVVTSSVGAPPSPAIASAGAAAQQLPGIQAGVQGPASNTYAEQVRQDAARARATSSARAAVPSVPSAAAPAPTAAAPATRSGVMSGIKAASQTRGMDAVRTLGRGAARVAPVVGAALGGKEVYDTAADPNTTKLDVAKEVADQTGMLAGGIAGFGVGGIPGAIVGGAAAPVADAVNEKVIRPNADLSDAIGGTINAGLNWFGGGIDDTTHNQEKSNFKLEQQQRAQREQSAAAGGADPGEQPERVPTPARLSVPGQKTEASDLDNRVEAGEIGGYIQGADGRQITVDRAGQREDGGFQPQAPAAQQQPGRPEDRRSFGAQSIVEGVRSREDAQNADYRNRAVFADKERGRAADASSKNLSNLRNDFNTAMMMGNRRAGATIAQAMGVEAGILGGMKPGAVDTRGNNQNIDPTAGADEALADSQASVNSLQADRQGRINQLMQSFMNDPNGDAGKAALANLQALEGKNNDRKYPVDVPMGEANEFGEVPMGRGLYGNGGLEYDPRQQGKGAAAGATRKLPDGTVATEIRPGVFETEDGRLFRDDGK